MKRQARPNRCLYPKKDVWLLVPGLCGFLIFYVLPFVVSFRHAMIKSAFVPVFVGLDNFRAALQNSYYQLALKNSLLLALLLPALVLPFALLFALTLRSVPALRRLQSAFLLPAFLPSSAVAAQWLLLFAPGQEFVSALGLGGLITKEWLCLITLAGWKNLGIPLVLILGALLGLDRDREEAAALDGANAFQRFIYIVFPQLRPTLLFTLIYIIMCSQRLFREAYLLYGAYPNESVYMVQHYMNNHFAKLNYQYLSSGAIILAGLLILFLSPLFWRLKHFGEETA